jgi:hypothetical protein
MGHSENTRKQSGGIRVLVIALLLVVTGDLVGLAVVDGGHGPAADASASDATGPPAGIGSTDPSASGPTTTTAASSSGSSRDRAAGPTPSTTTTVPVSSYLPDEGWDFGVTLSPVCAVVGQLITLTLHLEPNTGGSLVAVYADGDYHGTMHAGQAESNGVLVYRWTAPPAPGDALLLITAGGGPEKKSGRKTRPFRIVTKAKEC